MKEKLINKKVTNKIHSKTACIAGKILNGIRQPVLFFSGFDSLHGQAKNKKLKQTSQKKLALLGHLFPSRTITTE